MFLGTLFFVYKNYQLVKEKDSPLALIDENDEPIVNQDENKEPIINQNVDKDNVSKNIEINIINFDILNKDNYKTLIDNQVEPLIIEPGNQNLFEYYE